MSRTCSDFIGEQLCSENCVNIWRFTKICISPKLQLKAYRYITDHFEDVIGCDEFLELSVEEFIDFLDRDDLNVREESTVCEAVMRWIRHEPAERLGHIGDLLWKVQSFLFLPLVQIHVFSSLATSGDPTNCIKAYDFKANDWIDITNHLEDPLSYHGAVFLDGYVYCIGGFERMEYINTVCRFDLKTRTWQEVGPMHCRRCYMSVAVLNGCIYAMGGYDGNTRLNSAECYYPDTNKWTEIAPMFEQRSHASGTTLDEKVGENNGSILTHMTTRELNIPLLVLSQVGGSDGSNHLRTAEAYNPLTNTWTEVSSMINPRSNFGIEVLDRRIFAVGGFTGFTNTCKVEYYDITTNEWTEAHDMNISRTGLSCCVIYGLPNMAEYAVPRDLPLALVEEMEWESSGSN
uniref:Kelch like family member 10 n=1 Tax=Acanthochromis polyacanthus TaxID=80966 RepID=A0A3Q1GD55_9TELE